MRVDVTSDPAEFRRVGFPFLASDPVRYTKLLTTVRDRLDGFGREDDPAAYAVVLDDTRAVIGAAVCTSSYVLLGGASADSASALARALSPVLTETGGVDGEMTAAASFAETWSAAQEVTFCRVGGNRLHRMGAFTPKSAPGAPRLATAEDLDIVHEWYSATRREFGESVPADNSWAVGRVGAGRVYLWEDEGRPVSLVGRQVPIFGVTRIGPVYTPPDSRCRGYAGALTSHVSAQFLAGDGQTCLFTDPANPTSNKIYAAIGYEPVADFDCYDFG